MTVTQSNTTIGALPKNSGADLTGKEGRLVKLQDGGTKAEVILPAAITDRVLFVIDDGAVEDKPSSVIPFEPSRNIRVRAKGAGSGGDALVLAAIAGDDAGKLRALPAAAGTYHVLAIAEEDFVDGQLALVRPTSREAVVVS